VALVDQYKIAAFEQVVVMGPRVGRNAAAVEGACHNFSLHWLSMILTDPGSPADSRMAVLSKNAGGANPVLQKVFGDRWDLEGMRDSDQMICQIHGLVTHDEVPFSGYGAAALAAPLFQNVGKGGIYSFWFIGGVVGASGGAHSVAFYTNQMNQETVLHFFDPNFGEFLLTAGEFGPFWDELTGRYGPMRRHMLRSVTASKRAVLGGR
jgi:hypothetical protein